MGKKSTARAAAVAQYLANAADAGAYTRLPGKRPDTAWREPRLETDNAYWGKVRHNDPRGEVPNYPDEKVTFNVQVWYTDDVDEDATVFEVTVREVKS